MNLPYKVTILLFLKSRNDWFYLFWPVDHETILSAHLITYYIFVRFLKHTSTRRVSHKCNILK